MWNVIYYDYKENKNAQGYKVRHECRACDHGSFIGNCTCTYTEYRPIPETIPFEIKELLANESLAVQKEGTQKQFTAYFKMLIARTRIKLIEKKVLNAVTIKELKDNYFSFQQNTRRFISGNKTWIIANTFLPVPQAKYNPWYNKPLDYREIRLKVILDGHNENITNSSKILKIESAF